jgi:hypothetical protein
MKQKITGMIVKTEDGNHQVAIGSKGDIFLTIAYGKSDKLGDHIHFQSIGEAFFAALALLELCSRATMTRVKMKIGPKKLGKEWGEYEVTTDTDVVKVHDEGRML